MEYFTVAKHASIPAQTFKNLFKPGEVQKVNRQQGPDDSIEFSQYFLFNKFYSISTVHCGILDQL
jgi:hypothetical protein